MADEKIGEGMEEEEKEAEEKGHDLARFNLRNLAQNVLEVVRRFAGFKLNELAGDGLYYAIQTRLEPIEDGARLIIELHAMPETINALTTEFSTRVKAISRRFRHSRKMEEQKYGFIDFSASQEDKGWREV